MYVYLYCYLLTNPTHPTVLGLVSPATSAAAKSDGGWEAKDIKKSNTVEADEEQSQQEQNTTTKPPQRPKPLRVQPHSTTNRKNIT